LGGTSLFHENAVLKVAAALRRGGGLGGIGRRSEIGSNIFIGGGVPDRRICHFSENAVFKGAAGAQRLHTSGDGTP